MDEDAGNAPLEEFVDPQSGIASILRVMMNRAARDRQAQQPLPGNELADMRSMPIRGITPIIDEENLQSQMEPPPDMSDRMFQEQMSPDDLIARLLRQQQR